MMFFFDRDENYIGNSSEEYTLTRDLNKLNTLEFNLDYELEKGYRVVLIENNKVYEFIISEIDYVRNDYIMFSYLCNDSLIELNGYLIQEERHTETLKDNLDLLLKGTRFNYTISGYDTSIKKKTGYYRISVLEAFNNLINTFEIEFDVNIKLNSSKNAIEQRTIEIKRQGKKLNDRLEFGKNIIEFERNIFADEVYTALVGLGKGEEKFDEEGNATGGYGRKITFADVNNGIWYVEDLEAKEIYGIGKKGNKVHKMGIVNFSDVTNKNELLELTKKELQRVNHINAEYTIDVAVLGKEYNLGDEIPTIDDYINYRDHMRVVKIVSTPSGSTLTFGTRMASFTSSQNKVIKDLQEETQNEVQSVISAFLENSSELFFGKDGYPYTLEGNNEYGLPAGIYVFDKPIDQNPSGLVGLGGGSIVIANNKDADGKWQVVTAINSQGIAGSEILTHSITGNKLVADVGQELDLSSNVSIISTVSQEDFSSFMDEEIKPIKEQFSQINQNKESIETIIADSGKYMTQSQTVDTIQTIFGNTEELANKTAQELEEIKTAIKTGVDENGNTYTQWGSDKASVRVGSDGIEMTQGETPIMTLKDGLVTTTSLYVSNEIGFGNHTAQKYGTVYTIFAPNGGN